MDQIFNAKIANPGKNNIVHFYINVDGKEVKKSASKVVVDLLTHYKDLVTSKYGHDIDWVVSKPQTWNANQNKVFHESLREAGIVVLDTITEPLAAQYGYRH